MKVGIQAFQRMVSDCTKHLQPRSMPNINDLLSGTRAIQKSEGRQLDYDALLEAYFDQAVRRFETLEKYRLKVLFEKCPMFMTRVKYCGHILHDGKPSPAPSKVGAIRSWLVDVFRTLKQMKGYLGLVN